MNRKLEDEIATLEAKIAEADMVKATFAQLWEFSRSLLVDIAAAWNQANVDQKQRVQNILFSGGLKYHPEKGILNPDNQCLFNQLENFLGGKMCLVVLLGRVEPATFHGSLALHLSGSSGSFTLRIALRDVMASKPSSNRTRQLFIVRARAATARLLPSGVPDD
jgi:hypothetical protein